jgi:hypothetical protein
VGPVTISKAIDPARVGISKSLMTSPCERKGYFSETVRDSNGRRLSFPLPERVTFGSAVDEAVTYLVWTDREGRDWTVDEAVRLGMVAAERALGWPLVEDQLTFRVQLTNAINLYVTSDDGLQRIQRLYGEGLRLQGNDGETLRSEDGVIGTPDYITDRRVGDLKTAARNDFARKVWRSPEMGVYAYLFASTNGAIPETVFYQAYIRTQRPSLVWVEEPATSELVAYGQATADHWRELLAIGRAELFPTSIDFCGDCPYRLPMPEYGHDGCAVGRLVPSKEGATE